LAAWGRADAPETVGCGLTFDRMLVVTVGGKALRKCGWARPHTRPHARQQAG
jgi:hypothetical protein